ncbi:MAG: hypothetical protein HY692_09725 [Cyanobacteria bacterium NC_groundwater_1444_Ag_S-0.65um_54_12]|nr:hypothetical protein [Cyanobacteria bacterium NC_groundwater_1444_Ag_S-0.65um_54_12]
MASFKHYLPAATSAEQVLLDELAHEHPRHLHVHVRPQKEIYQIFFEVDSQTLAGYVWFLLARLKNSQRRIEELYRRPANLPVGEYRAANSR